MCNYFNKANFMVMNLIIVVLQAKAKTIEKLLENDFQV